jgi:hypothetical protein
LAAYRLPLMLLLLTAVVAVAAADTSAVVAAGAAALHISVAVVHTSVVETLGLDGSRLGMGQACGWWLGADPDQALVSGLGMAPVHSSLVGTADISGTAVGGGMVWARAGYGRTITVSTCGPVIKADISPLD